MTAHTYLEAAWHLRWVIAFAAVAVWFACRMVNACRDINARLAADVAEREEFVAAWNADGTLQSYGGLTADEFLARVRTRPDVDDAGVWR